MRSVGPEPPDNERVRPWSDHERRKVESGRRAVPTREVRHEYTRNWPRILDHLGSSLLISTYQAGKVVAVGVGPGGQELELSYHNFEKAMGMAVRPDTWRWGPMRRSGY